MKNILIIFPFFLLIIGCATTEKNLDENEYSMPVIVDTTFSDQPAKIDTLEVKIESDQKKAFESKITDPNSKQPAIKSSIEEYSVQIGAFRTEEKAYFFASLARDKLNEDIYNIYDKQMGWYRILIGNFNSLDAAREYRDNLKKKHKEYYDAFVIDVRKEIRK